MPVPGIIKFSVVCVFFTVIFWLSCIVLSIIALVDVLRNKFVGNDKILWFFVVLIPFLGFILYFSIGKKQTIKNSSSVLENSPRVEKTYRRISDIGKP